MRHIAPLIVFLVVVSLAFAATPSLFSTVAADTSSAVTTVLHTYVPVVGKTLDLDDIPVLDNYRISTSPSGHVTRIEGEIYNGTGAPILDAVIGVKIYDSSGSLIFSDNAFAKTYRGVRIAPDDKICFRGNASVEYSPDNSYELFVSQVARANRDPVQLGIIWFRLFEDGSRLDTIKAGGKNFEDDTVYEVLTSMSFYSDDQTVQACGETVLIGAHGKRWPIDPGKQFPIQLAMLENPPVTDVTGVYFALDATRESE